MCHVHGFIAGCSRVFLLHIVKSANVVQLRSTSGSCLSKYPFVGISEDGSECH